MKNNNNKPATQLEVKTIRNPMQRFVGFVYQSVGLDGSGSTVRVKVKLEPHRGMAGKCGRCLKPSPGYDQLPAAVVGRAPTHPSDAAPGFGHAGTGRGERTAFCV